MSKSQFHRSKKMLKALNIKQDSDLSIPTAHHQQTTRTTQQSDLKENDNTVCLEAGKIRSYRSHHLSNETTIDHDQPDIDNATILEAKFVCNNNPTQNVHSYNVYNNPEPSTSKDFGNKENENDDNLSDISKLYDSDDSVNDPDFMFDVFGKTRCDFFFGGINESETDSDLDIPTSIRKVNEAPKLLSLLPPSTTTTTPIYIATYPDSIIFKDQDQANNFRDTNITVDFIAMYPGPIYTSTNDISRTHSIESENQLRFNDNSSINSNDNAREHSDRNKKKSVEKKLKYPFIEETCGNKCIRHCKFFTAEERKTIWENYWDMNYENRKSFLLKCTKIKPVKRRKNSEKNPNVKHIKNESRFYYLPKTNEKGEKDEFNVCRNFFLKTLGHKTDAVITELSRGIKRTALYGEVTEKRGGKKPRLARNIITSHILSFNPTVSHYRRNNAPLARYLPRTLTIQFMINDFKEKFPSVKCSKEVYRQNIKLMHISFKFPKGDKCTDCESFEQEIALCEDGNVPEILKLAFENHKSKANKAIQNYKEDAVKDNTINIRYYSMDLQKVMLLPDMPKVKDSFFLSRLITFNLTFATIQKECKVNSTCVLWHEGFAGRDANNIVDALMALIEKQRDLQHLVIWCDNCCSQNKNWIIYTALINIVNSEATNLESVTLKYLTKGHTHMSADGVHGNIETQIKRRHAIYDYEDYKDAVQSCRQYLDIVEVENKYGWAKKKRTPRRNNTADILNTFALKSVVEVKFISGSRNLFYKEDFDDTFKELDFLMKKFNPELLPETNNTPRGIKEIKKDGIVSKLVPLMPSNRRQFWVNLPVCDESEDLVSGGQMITED